MHAHINNLALLADEYAAAKRDKRHAETALAEANTRLADSEQRLADAMIDADIQKIVHGGIAFTLDISTRVRPLNGHQDDVIDWIIHNGGADLVKPSMHHARRDSFLREMLKDEHGETVIPTELVGLVQVENRPRVGIRGLNT